MRKIFAILLTFVVASFVLFISIFRTASPRFLPASYSPRTVSIVAKNGLRTDYAFAFPGSILPGSILWPIKAGRDRLWYLVTTNGGKKAELNLLFSDKRAISALKLFEKGEYQLGVTTLSKAENYLRLASNIEKENRIKGNNTSEFVTTLARASIAHRLLIEEIMQNSPSDLIPELIKITDTPKAIYKESASFLEDRRLPVPPSPFIDL